jgi:hypothetical protein
VRQVLEITWDNSTFHGVYQDTAAGCDTNSRTGRVVREPAFGPMAVLWQPDGPGNYFLK